jgi:TRAP-type uncharacterized transport system fused permease subunit
MKVLYLIPLCILGMLCWSVFIQGHWKVHTPILERLLFLGLAFLLVNPNHLSIGEMMINKHLVNGLAIAAVVAIYLSQRARANRTSAPAAA